MSGESGTEAFPYETVRTVVWTANGYRVADLLASDESVVGTVERADDGLPWSLRLPSRPLGLFRRVWRRIYMIRDEQDRGVYQLSVAHREERLAGIAVCISTADHEVATIGLRATRGPFRAAHAISVDDRVVGWLSADMRFIAGTDDDTVVLIHPPTGSFSTVEYTLEPSGPYTAPFFATAVLAAVCQRLGRNGNQGGGG